ncbi:MAG: RDD family protein [Acidobacteria bacterium]|nr:RDD family protein [Acidobacteriota bacterium]
MLLEPSNDEAGVAVETPADTAVAAPPAARLLSAVVDVALLSGIDAAVVYLTAQIASVPMGQVLTLPLVPLAAFIVGLNVAYLAVFTANGGQTLGKMATGLRVEATDGSLTFGGAIVRVAVAIAGGLVVGAGFIPALFRADRRAVHDQIAHTRVVKVSA